MNNYSTNIRLNPSENGRLQFTYASQVYGTFFAIYAQFITREILDDEGNAIPNKVILEQIDFELINYKGLINISLEDVKIDIGAIDGVTEQDPQEIKIDVILKGAVLDAPQLRLTKSDIEKEVLNNSNFYVERNLLNLNGKTRTQFNQDSDAESSIGGIFDEEFFYRNGKLEPRRRLDGDFAIQIEKEKKKNSLSYTDAQANLYLGPWCIGTFSKITTD